MGEAQLMFPRFSWQGLHGEQGDSCAGRWVAGPCRGESWGGRTAEVTQAQNSHSPPTHPLHSHSGPCVLVLIHWVRINNWAFEFQFPQTLLSRAGKGRANSFLVADRLTSENRRPTSV